MERVKDGGTNVLLVARGDCRLGRTRTDEAGNVVEQTGAKLEPNAEGGCVAICELDAEKMEPVGAAEVYGDWDAAHFLARVPDKLGPGRPANIPNFREILKKAMADGEGKDFFCDYCERYGYSCRDCIVTEWLEDMK